MKLPLILLSVAVAMIVRAADSGSTPATVTKEGDLVVVTLKPDAEERLRLKVVPVERKAVANTRLFAGDVVLALGASGEVAPVLGGTLDELLRVADLQIQADNRVEQAKVQLEVAEIAFDRAEKMLKAEAGSVRVVDEARAALGLAKAALQAAKAQREILGAPVGRDGVARRQWVRVSIYTGEAALLDPKANAAVGELTASVRRQSAKPVAGPSTATAATSTIDWFFELPADAKLRPGERIAVEIPTLGSESEALVVPFSAVLHDINGGQWVYEQTSDHHFTRRRVQVTRVVGGNAVLASGPAAGAKVVTDGAAELFGSEFMTGK